MSDDPVNHRGSTPTERWIQHFIQGISLAAVIGGGALLWDLKTSNAIIQTELKNMSQRMEDFKLFMSDRYTSTDAEREHLIIERELQDHESRIRKLESK